MAEKGRGKRIRFQGGTVFPVVLTTVAIVGVLLIGYARATVGDQQSGPRSTQKDNWHIAYGIYNCDHYIDPLKGTQTAANAAAWKGVSSQEDGIIYYNPTDSSVSGGKANFKVFLANYNVRLSSTNLTVPAIDINGLPAPVPASTDSTVASSADSTPTTVGPATTTPAGAAVTSAAVTTAAANAATTTASSLPGPSRQAHTGLPAQQSTATTVVAPTTTSTSGTATTAGATSTTAVTPTTTAGTATTAPLPAGDLVLDTSKDKCGGKTAELRTYVWKDATKWGDFSVVRTGDVGNVRITNDNMAIVVAFIDPQSETAKNPPQPLSIARLAALTAAATASTSSTIPATAGTTATTGTTAGTTVTTTPAATATTAASAGSARTGAATVTSGG